MKLPVFKMIRLGTHRTIDELRLSIHDSGQQIGSWGDNILNKITLGKKEIEVALHMVTVAELTKKDVATNREINEGILAINYELCPAEVGPQLRLQYPDQPYGEWIRIAMNPVIDPIGNYRIFGVDHGFGVLWLHGDHGQPDYRWTRDTRFVCISYK